MGSLLVGLLDNFGKALFPELSYFTLFAPMAAHPRHPAHGALRPRDDPRAARCSPPWRRRLALALAAPLLPAYPLTLVTQALIVAILAMSLDVLLGYTGLPSLGHAAYWGVGAYAVALLATERQASASSGCLVAGVLLAAGTAAVFGLVAIRAAGTYFLMITLALGMVVWGLAFRWVSLTKGDNGVSGVPRPSCRPALSLERAAALLLLRAGRAPSWRGRCWGCSSSRPSGSPCAGSARASRACGASATTCGCTSISPSCSPASLAGWRGVLWAYYNGFVRPPTCSSSRRWRRSSWWRWAARAPSSARRWARGVIVFLKNFVSIYTKRWLLILGAVYIGVILFAPRGVMGALRGRPR